MSNYKEVGYDVMAAGSLMVDTILSGLAMISKPGEVTHLNIAPVDVIGGQPHNIVVSLVKLGYDPKKLAVLGTVGKDDYGERIYNLFEKYDLTTEFIKRETGEKTGRNIIIEEIASDRRFHCYMGANKLFDVEFAVEFLQQYRPKIFASKPYYTGNYKDTEEVFKSASNETLTLLDIRKTEEAGKKNILSALKYVDIVHGNEEEVRDLTGEDIIKDGIESILGRGVKVIFVTRDGEGKTTLQTREGIQINQNPFDSNQYIPEGASIDETGCGDAFCAGLFYKLLEFENFDDLLKDEDKLREILMFSQAVGASSATRFGATEGVSKDLVDRIISEQGANILEK